MDAKQIIKYFGGELQAALALGKTPQTIKNWKNGKKIPLNTQFFIENLSKGKLKASSNLKRISYD